MDDSDKPSAVTNAELNRLVCEFEEKFHQGTSDADHFMTFSEIEGMLGKLIGDTNVLYSAMFQQLMKDVDEKDIVRKKKPNTPEEGSD